MKNAVSCDMTPCDSLRNDVSGEIIRVTRRNIPEDGILHRPWYRSDRRLGAPTEAVRTAVRRECSHGIAGNRNPTCRLPRHTTTELQRFLDDSMVLMLMAS
jgi:hypothetical protein